ncbi:MAG: hypothetical protein JO250_09595 [Armatimonadetes bacterium]|nr:hypothetical protein [Armatimonadota bacterium]
MTVTINLTPEQVQRLRREARGRRFSAESMFGELLNQTLSQIETPSQEHKERIPALHRGQVWIADDFDDPLPDSFWLGEE